MLEIDLAFPHSYETEGLPELPGTGKFVVPVLYFPVPKNRPEHNGLWLKMTPATAKPWVGVFKFLFDSPHTFLRVVSTPAPDCVWVISGSAGYIVKVDKPEIDNIAGHLDKYPNFAIDTAARMEYLMLMPPEKVSAFLLKYQDRILYGTDLDLDADANFPDELTEWQSTYARDWKFLATGETLVVEGKQVRGLNLPEPVLQKIFRTNAIHWIPGL